MFNFGFSPGQTVVNLGDTVKWTNTSGTHTVTSTGNWDSGTVMSGNSFSQVFNSPGTFNYFCAIHGAAAMSGTVIVNP